MIYNATTTHSVTVYFDATRRVWALLGISYYVKHKILSVLLGNSLSQKNISFQPFYAYSIDQNTLILSLGCRSYGTVSLTRS